MPTTQGTFCCYDCKRHLSASSYTVDNSRACGLNRRCKDCCHNRRAKLWQDDKANPKRRERRLARSRKWHRANQHKRQIARYRITPEDYAALLREQGGLCFICRKPETRKIRGKVSNLSVDHDHETEEVRGLLCSRCNLLIGMVSEDRECLERAIAYLERSKEQASKLGGSDI